jgi:hypothetical protein
LDLLKNTNKIATRFEKTSHSSSSKNLGLNKDVANVLYDEDYIQKRNSLSRSKNELTIYEAIKLKELPISESHASLPLN